MPCLNEAETLAVCIRKAHEGLREAHVIGEVLIADNGSTDGSQEIAIREGARVVAVERKGYGNALRGGIEAAKGRWIIIGDSDDSYDFSRISGFVRNLRNGDDLVMGCRLPSGGGTIAPGAMPWKNRWIGNPILSFIGRLFFRCPAHDFHCGLRGFTKEAFTRMDLKTTGMEFASEMVIKATLKGLRISEVPITLHKDGRSRPPHLKPWRDGWRHLRFMLIYSPRWLFLIPGLLMALLGGIATAVLSFRSIVIGNLHLDVGTQLVTSMALIVGLQLLTFAFSSKVFAIGEGLLPEDQRFSQWFRWFSLEKGVLVGLVSLAVGLGLLLQSLWVWRAADFGPLVYSENLRRLIPAATLIVVGAQMVFSSFFLSVLGLKTQHRKPPGETN